MLLIISVTSCRYFNVSPVDGITTKNVTEKPKNEDLIGTWEIDEFSYDLIIQNGYESDKTIELKLLENNYFEIENFPEFADVFNESGNKKYHNLTGKWKVEKDFNNKYWVLSLNFDHSEFYNQGMNINYDLFLKNNKLIIWNFIGDPDSGERFLFEKKTSS